jgi:hypothetical protein
MMLWSAQMKSCFRRSDMSTRSTFAVLTMVGFKFNCDPASRTESAQGRRWREDSGSREALGWAMLLFGGVQPR